MTEQEALPGTDLSEDPEDPLYVPHLELKNADLDYEKTFLGRHIVDLGLEILTWSGLIIGLVFLASRYLP